MDPQSTLTQLPPSPASSVLSLGSHPDHEIDEDPKRIIGVRELIKMVRGGKRDTATQSHPRKGIIIHGMPTDDGSPADISGPPPGYNEECFAKDVAITGWKVVGGSKGGEKAKVGAYVGESPQRPAIASPGPCGHTDAKSTTSSLSCRR